MAVDAHHPDYDAMIDDWTSVRDAMLGAHTVKDKTEEYLPKPDGFNGMNDGGTSAYEAYITRAKFPNFVAPTVRGMNGVIHRVEAQIEVPEAMAYLFEKATKDGLPLEGLHRRITNELLQVGRYSLLVDVDPKAKDKRPYLAGYTAESLINWSKDRDFFVLDETQDRRTGFDWEEFELYRVLEIVNGVYTQRTYDAESKAASGVLATDADGNTIVPDDDETFTTPTALGGKPLEEIPFVVIGSTDVTVDIDEVPMLGVAQCAYASYRLDADYRHQLYMSGAETLFVSGARKEDLPQFIGAGVSIALPADATAAYVGPKGVGIDAHRTAIIDERESAAIEGAKLFSNESKAAESGDALRIRFAAQTATLTSIAQAAAQGLEKALRNVAVMLGSDPDLVIVKPNLSFIDTTMTAAEALNLVKVWQAGGISKLTLYENLQRGEVASPERTYDEEESLINDELPETSNIGVDDGANAQGAGGEDTGNQPTDVPDNGQKDVQPV